jgi:hypothetical protein
VGLKSLKSLNLTNGYPNKNKNKVKSKPLELFELAGKKLAIVVPQLIWVVPAKILTSRVRRVFKVRNLRTRTRSSEKL